MPVHSFFLPVVTRALRVAAFALVAWGTCASAQKLAPIPSPTVRVNDNAAMLTESQEAKLDTDLDDYEKAHKVRIVLLTIASSAPEPIEVYGERAADAWKIGKPGGAGDVLILVARDNRGDLHRVTIEAGPDRQSTLTDPLLKRIIGEDVLPRFQLLDYYGGLTAGIARIELLLEGGEMPPPSPTVIAAAADEQPRDSVAPLVAAGGIGVGVVLLLLLLRASARRMCYLAGDRAVNRAFNPMIVGDPFGKHKAPLDEGNGFGGGYVGPGIGGYAGGGGDFSGGSASGTW